MQTLSDQRLYELLRNVTHVQNGAKYILTEHGQGVAIAKCKQLECSSKDDIKAVLHTLKGHTDLWSRA